ncbi:putative transmembrane protein [Toxoplasma gondii TgCatPRC2]|uniref:Transmembrane protein n=2 Tax=Toxoplasma gondii TaxID=5811 RepID=A0A139Y6X9_TOXGO|nr:hypothetical protein TGARI_269130 [Toxoplasma gondii ARI]KYK70892.1 putative transmembrane protein [Toxoplasma gondii TgCatPRC2]
MNRRNDCQAMLLPMSASPCSPRRGGFEKYHDASQKADDDDQPVTRTEDKAVGLEGSTSDYGFWASACVSSHSASSEITASDLKLQHHLLDVSFAAFPSSSITVAKMRPQGTHSLLNNGMVLVEQPQHAPSALGCANDVVEDYEMDTDAPYHARILPPSPLLSGCDPCENLSAAACAEGLLHGLHQQPRGSECLDRTVRERQEDDSDIHEGYANADDFETVVSPQSVSRAVEACDVNTCSTHTFVVASDQPDADLPVSGVCLQIHPDGHDEPWSDVVLTRGQDPGFCVVGSVIIGKSNEVLLDVKTPQEGLAPNEVQAQRDAFLLGASGVHHSRAAWGYPYKQHARETKLSSTACGSSDSPTAEGSKMKTTSGAQGRLRNSEGSCSLPSRLLRHICQTVQAYDQHRMNKNHLIVVGSTALIALTVAMLLICIVHTLLGKTPAGESPFLP